MDPTKFDAFTKALATSTSRRQALKAIGAALGGALGFSNIGRAFAACHPTGHHCGKDKDCCSNVCCNHVCCASGQSCQHGTCVTPTTTTTAPPTTTTSPPPMCSSGGDICAGVTETCGSSGGITCACATDVDGSNVCVGPPVTCNNCTSDADCGSGLVCSPCIVCSSGKACMARC